MKNRTIIGIVCIVLALILTFAIAPLVNKMAESRVDIIPAVAAPNCILLRTIELSDLHYKMK